MPPDPTFYGNQKQPLNEWLFFFLIFLMANEAKVGKYTIHGCHGIDFLGMLFHPSDVTV